MSNARTAELKRDLRKLLGEMTRIQESYHGEPMPDDVASEFASKAAEAEEIQNLLDEDSRQSQVQKLHRYLRDVPEDQATNIPAAKKSTEPPAEDNQIAGYVTLGQYAVASQAYEDFAAKGFPQENCRLVVVEEAVEHGQRLLVPLTKAQRQQMETKSLTTKAVPTLGAGVIDPQRLTVMPKVTGDQRLRIRDVYSVGRTTSNAVEYIREESFTSGADYQLAGSIKGEATAEWTKQTANVQTIAHWMPATVQQLSDWGQLRSLIDNRLQYGLRLKEEEELMYGAGGANAIEGLLTVSGTQDIATADARITSPTIIDQIMVGNTEIYSAGYEANAVLLSPIDYEAVILLKGTDDHYLRQVFPTAAGELRVWGLDMVRSQALEGAGTERNMIVGDFRVGAELLLREDVSVMLGFKDDDFIRNLRTVLAEERAAHAIYAPAAFAVLQTAA